MRRLSLAGLVTTGFLAAAAFAPTQAQALPLAAAPASLAATIGTNNAVEQVRYVCRRVRRCNRWGCGWHRRCHWRPGYRGPYFNFYLGPRRHHHWRHWRRHRW